MKLMGILDGLEDEEKTGFMEIIIMQGAFVVNRCLECLDIISGNWRMETSFKMRELKYCVSSGHNRTMKDQNRGDLITRLIMYLFLGSI